MRILSHNRGNPDPDVSRSLNHRVTSRLYYARIKKEKDEFPNPRLSACRSRTKGNGTIVDKDPDREQV